MSEEKKPVLNLCIEIQRKETDTRTDFPRYGDSGRVISRNFVLNVGDEVRISVMNVEEKKE